MTVSLQRSLELDTEESDWKHRFCLFEGNHGLKLRWSGEPKVALNEEVSYVDTASE